MSSDYVGNYNARFRIALVAQAPMKCAHASSRCVIIVEIARVTAPSFRVGCNCTRSRAYNVRRDTAIDV